MCRRTQGVDCLVGMQWGSEGKGKIAAYLSREYNAFVRSGGPQAGHTFYDSNLQKHVLRQIPCGVRNSDCLLYIASGGLLNIEVLANEMRRYQLYPNRLMISPHAMVVTEKHIEEEKSRNIEKRIASTVEGVGAAQADKIWRTGKIFTSFAEADPELYFFCNDTSDSLYKLIQSSGSILLEGTQGFGLCLNHGSYPYCTSRDATSSALLSDAGIAPSFHNQTIGIMRTYPIRVGGNSGPAGKSQEIDWNIIRNRAGYKTDITEHTTVTGRIRRVFEQDIGILHESVRINGINLIALMFIDYINAQDYGKTSWKELSKKSKDYVHYIEMEIGVPVTFIGTGPYEHQIIDRRTKIHKPVNIPDEVLGDFGFSNNFQGHSWHTGYFERYLDCKLEVSRKILKYNN